MNINNFARKRWFMLVLYGIINLCIGSLYAWSVFAGPLQEQLNVRNLSMVYTVSTSLGPVTMIAGGFLQRKLNTRWILLLSGAAYGLGILLSGFATGKGSLFLTYGLIAGLAAGLAYGCTMGNSVKMFPDKRGLAGGVAAATYGGSSVIIPPVANVLIERVGVMNSLKVLGAIFLILICVCGLMVKECPEDFVPVGWASNARKTISEGMRWSQMMKTADFYIMLGLLLCGAVSGLMTISQASAMAQKLVGMSVSAAAIMVSMLSVFNAAGRILSGMLSDKIGRIKTLMLMLLVSLAGIFLLGISSSGRVLIFAVGIASIGFGFGAFLGVYPGFTADRFGQKHQSVNYGIMFVGFAIAGLIGPSVASRAYHSSGTYGIAFAAAAALCVVGLLLASIYDVWRRKCVAREILSQR